MQAIITRHENKYGAYILMMGFGSRESEARKAAFEIINKGPDELEREYQGGELVTVSAKLEAVLTAEQWDTHYNEEGEFLFSEVNDNYFIAEKALNRLIIDENGELSYYDF